MLQKTKGSISEKSFYTYFKNTPEKLPRIDVLNILSTYIGETSWATFSNRHQIKREENKRKSSYIYIFITISFIIGTILLYTLTHKENTFSFCFIDADRGSAIQNIPLDIIVLNDEESPRYYKSDSLGCFTWTSTDSYINFKVQSPYHKTETIRRQSNATSESVQLLTDDYNLMLHYYANNNIKDWKKRKQQLEQLISDNAILIEILPYDLGVEIFSKTDLIEKLMTPTESLKHFEIIESQKQQNKIVKLKFRTRYE